MVVIKQAQAAPEAVDGPEVQTGPAGQDYGQQGPYAGPGEDVVAMVARINAEEFGGWFDVADVLAVVQIESSFRADAYRAEPQINDASYGLMQVLYSTARDRGYDGDPGGLFDPETNLRLGMAHLRWSWDFLANRMRSAPAKTTWIGSYNAGVGNALKGYTPWAYVAKFTAARALWVGRV